MTHVASEHPRNHRRGAAYVFVLATSLLVTVIGLSVLTVAQIQSRGTRSGNDADAAEVLAESAVEYALNTLAGDSNWRTTYTSGTATATRALGDGSIYFKLIDEIDGSLSNNTTDAIRIYGYGQLGNAVKVCSVQALSDSAAVTCLGTTIDSVGTMTLTSLFTTSSGTLASNTQISGTGTYSAVNFESAGAISVSGTAASKSANATARTFPTGSTVFSTYSDAAMGGTTITFSLLPFGTSPAVPTISHRLMSPAVNPWGSTNAKGIYIFNCNGNSVNITNSRIVGTLVFLNAGTVYLSTSGIIEPAVSNYPVLLVQGNLQINSTTAMVTEGTPTPAVNMNPNSTPLPYIGGGGSGSNGSTSDSFSSSITGLIYASGNISITNQPNIKGVVIAGGTLTATGTVTLTHTSTYLSNPPPAFSGGPTITPVAGSWRWDSAP